MITMITIRVAVIIVKNNNDDNNKNKKNNNNSKIGRSFFEFQA